MYYSEQLIEQYSKSLSESENNIVKALLEFLKEYYKNMAL